MATDAVHTCKRWQEWRDYGIEMRIGVVVGVDDGSHEVCCVDGRGDRVVCARIKGWYGSGGGSCAEAECWKTY